MANILKMEQKLLIQELLKLGRSYRRIEKETGHRRETIAKYDPDHPQNQESKSAKVPTEIPTVMRRQKQNCLALFCAWIFVVPLKSIMVDGV